MVKEMDNCKATPRENVLLKISDTWPGHGLKGLEEHQLFSVGVALDPHLHYSFNLIDK